MSLVILLYLKQKDLLNILLQVDTIGKMVFEPREPNTTFFAMLVFLGGAVIVALARIFQRDIFLILAKSFLFFKTKEDLTKDGENLAAISSTLLIIQFFGIVSYILSAKFLVEFSLIPFLAVPAYILYTTITSWLLTRIIDNDILFKEIQHYSFVLFQSVGLIYLLMIFIDYYQPFIPNAKSILLLIPIGLLLALRIIRSSLLAWRENVPWYYIILYFWTLEILPVLVIAKLLFPEWFREWIV